MRKWKLALFIVSICLLFPYAASGDESIDFVLSDVSTIGFVNLPKATSSLPDDQWGSYSVDKMFDGQLQTSWSEGVDGPGVGQKIAFFVPRGAAKISILPGYGDERLFVRNNHLREAQLDLYLVKRTPGFDGDEIAERDVLSSRRLTFQDTMSFQAFPLDIDYTGVPSDESVLAVMTIEEVFKGTYYDDTCIAEIAFGMGDGEEAVLQAVRAGDTAKLAGLADRGQEMDFVSLDGRTPLQIAVERGDEAMVIALVNSGADIQMRAAESGETPLHVAIRTGAADVALWLIEYGADLNVRTRRASGWTSEEEGSRAPIHYVAEYGDPRLLRKLIERGVDVNTRTDSIVNYTPLHYALLHFVQGSEECLETVRILLESGAVINAIGGVYQRETPYRIAVRRKLTSVVQLMDEIGTVGDEYINYLRSEK